MPIYEYKCSECHHQFEKLIRVSGADGPTKCPECGEREPQRVMSSFAALGTSSKSTGSCGAPGPGFS